MGGALIMADIKETKELLAALSELLKALGPIFKDGFQAGQDIPALLALLVSNEDLKVKLQAAVDSAAKIPEEVKDLSLSEDLELLMVLAKDLPEILNAWKK